MPRPRRLSLGAVEDDLAPFAIEQMAGRILDGAHFVPILDVAESALPPISVSSGRASLAEAIHLIATLVSVPSGPGVRGDL